MLKRQLILFLAATAVVIPSALSADDECAANMTQQQPMQGPKKPNGQMMNSMQPSGHMQWMTNYQQAAEKAKKENKYLLLFFTGSDWCGWCKKIDSEVFSDPAFAKAAGGQFVFVELDFPMNKKQDPALSQQNNSLKQKFGISGYPTVIILDPNQNFVAETGYRPGGGQSYASYLMSLIQGNQG